MRTLLALFLLVLLGSGLWLLVADPQAHAERDPREGGGEEPRLEAAAYEAVEVGESGSAETSRVDLETHQRSPEAEDREIVEAPPGCVLEIEFEDADTQRSLQAFALEIHPAGEDQADRFFEWAADCLGELPESGGSLSIEDGAFVLRSAESGRARLRPPPGLSFAMRCRELEEVYAWIYEPTMLVPALGEGERRELLLLGRLAPSRSFYGRVTASIAAEAPIAGASVTASNAEVLPSSARTDSFGRFHVAAANWDDVYLLIEAEGFGPAYLCPRDGHDSPERALGVPLRPAAILHGVVRSGGEAYPGAEIEVVASAREMDSSFGFLGEIPQDHRWVAIADGFGRYELELSSEIQLRASVSGAGQSLASPPKAFRLAPGEHRELDFEIGPDVALHGVVVNQLGQTVSDVPVVAVAPSVAGAVATSPFFLDEELGSVEHRTTSNSSGNFRFDGLSPGTWIVGVPVDSQATSRSRVSPIGVVVELPPGREGDAVRLEVHSGLFLTGRVFDPNGSGVPAFVMATSKRGVGVLTATADGHGDFEVGPLLPGEYSLRAFAFGLGGRSTAMVVPAGTEGLKLQVVEGGSIAISVREEKRATGQVLMAHVMNRAGMSSTSTETTVGTEVEFSGLDPGTYDVVAVGNGWFGLVSEIEVESGGRQSVDVSVSPSAEVLLRAPATGGRLALRVMQQGAVLDFVNLEPGGSQRINVPPGTLDLQEWNEIDGYGRVQQIRASLAGREEFLIDFD